MNDPQPRPAGRVHDPVPGQGSIESGPRVTIDVQRRQWLEQHLRTDPIDRDAFLELATIYRHDQRAGEAKRVLEQARRIFPDDPEVLWQYEEAILARALQQFREVNDLAGRVQSAEADVELGRAQQDWSRRRIEICQARLSRRPELLHLRVVLGEALLDQEDYEAAMTQLQPILDNDELFGQANLLVGKCQLALGRPVDAMRSLRYAGTRRAAQAPLKIRIASLRLLCDTAFELGVNATLRLYQSQLKSLEAQLHAANG